MMEEIIREGSLRLVATESSCDVVLSCVGYKLMAHKIILSIASPVLQELLQQDSSLPTVLIFPDISATTMTLILDYIYNGNVSLLLSQLSDFLSIANLLKLKLEEDYLRFLRKKCDDTNYKFERCKYEVALKKPIYSEGKKMLPGLIPIEKVRKRGLFNKVFPSPWTPRDAQVLKDPRIDYINYEVQNYAVAINKNDSNNNVEVEAASKPTLSCELENTTQTANESHVEVPLKNGEQETVIQEEVNGSEKRTKEKEKPFKCNDCGKSFSQLRNYKYHRSIHDGTKEFSTRCPECGKVFNDRGYLSSHMKIHRDRKEYACQHCPKRFNQRVAYNMHLRIHTGLKPHECADCGKTFSRKMLLKQHQRVHTGERPYTCAECGKSFADRSNMSLHARLHTGEKPYSCGVCEKSFTKKHHLKTHMNFHTGAKPYKCEKCGVAFTQSSNMRTHFKKCVLKSDNQTPDVSDNVCTTDSV